MHSSSYNYYNSISINKQRINYSMVLGLDLPVYNDPQ